MFIAKEVVHALWLNSDETVLLSLYPYRETSTPGRLFKDILNMHIITTKRLFVLKYNYLTKEVQIINSFCFDKITELKVSTKKYKFIKDPILRRNGMHNVLAIKTIDNSYEFPLGFFVRKRIKQLIECVKRANSQVNVTIDYIGDDARQAREMMFEGIPENRRMPLLGLAILLGIGLFIALWRVILYLKTASLE